MQLQVEEKETFSKTWGCLISSPLLLPYLPAIKIQNIIECQSSGENWRLCCLVSHSATEEIKCREVAAYLSNWGAKQGPGFSTQSPVVSSEHQTPSQVITDSEIQKNIAGSSPYIWFALFFHPTPSPQGKINKLNFGGSIKNYNLWMKIQYLELLAVTCGGEGWMNEGWRIQYITVLRALFTVKIKVSTTLPGTLLFFNYFCLRPLRSVLHSVNFFPTWI